MPCTTTPGAAEVQIVPASSRTLLYRHALGPKHELFLSKMKFDDSAQHIVFTEYRMAVRLFASELVERLAQSLRAHAETWRWLQAPSVRCRALLSPK